jgi:hypothetical protein
MVLQGRMSSACDFCVKDTAMPANLQPSCPFSYYAFHRLLRHLFAHQMVLLVMHPLEDQMRTTVTLDDDLLAKAIKLTGVLDRSTVLREGLKALI